MALVANVLFVFAAIAKAPPRAPQIAARAPQIAARAPQIAARAPQIAARAPQIAVGGTRRAVASAFFGGVFAASFSPARATAAETRAPASVFESTCLGFGCNNYNGIGYGGMEKPTDEESIAFKEFIDLLQNAETRSKVTAVDIYGAAGERVYATIDGRKTRIGEGLPIEDPNGWSSSLWLVRILDNNAIPHTYHFRPTDKP